MENLVGTVISVMGDAYPELKKSPDHIRKVIRTEENAYAQTLGAGLNRLESLLATVGGTPQLSGSDVFQLTATYGLPLDDVLEIAGERGFSIDMEAYHQHVAEHQSVSRQGTKTSRLGDLADHLKAIAAEHGATAFLGYPEQSGPEALDMLQDMLEMNEQGFEEPEEVDGEPDNVEDMGSLFKSKEFQNLQNSITDLFGKFGNSEYDENLEDENEEFGEEDFPTEEEIFNAMDEDDFFSGAYPVATVPNVLVLGLFKDGQPVHEATAGDEVAVVLDQTPFYAESGGQVADTGWLTEGNCRVRVHSVVKSPEEIYVHYGTVENGSFTAESVMDAGIDLERRLDIMRNHTATHLMQGAMKRIIGTHVTQQGSYVGPDYLRFDFTNPEGVSGEILAELEKQVNEQVMADLALQVNWMSLEEARQLPGIIAPFGEKYGQRVRVVDIPGWDTEFCGGTHLLSTGEVGPFLIISEGAVSSGVRRIEAVTGRAALELIQSERAALKQIADELKVPRAKIQERITALQDELKGLRKELAKVQASASSADAAQLLEQAEVINGVKLVVHQFNNLDAKGLRDAYDAMKSRQSEGLFALLGGVADGKASMMAGATKDVAAKGLSAGDVIRTAAQAAGGNGGGKPEMAMAGAKDAAKLPDALAAGKAAAIERLQNLS